MLYSSFCLKKLGILRIDFTAQYNYYNAIKNIGYKKGLYNIAHPADKQQSYEL